MIVPLIIIIFPSIDMNTIFEFPPGPGVGLLWSAAPSCHKRLSSHLSSVHTIWSFQPSDNIFILQIRTVCWRSFSVDDLKRTPLDSSLSPLKLSSRFYCKTFCNRKICYTSFHKIHLLTFVLCLLLFLGVGDQHLHVAPQAFNHRNSLKQPTLFIYLTTYQMIIAVTDASNRKQRACIP